jgi:hypothetical protein
MVSIYPNQINLISSNYVTWLQHNIKHIILQCIIGNTVSWQQNQFYLDIPYTSGAILPSQSNFIAQSA